MTLLFLPPVLCVIIAAAFCLAGVFCFAAMIGIPEDEDDDNVSDPSTGGCDETHFY